MRYCVKAKQTREGLMYQSRKLSGLTMTRERLKNLNEKRNKTGRYAGSGGLSKAMVVRGKRKKGPNEKRWPNRGQSNNKSFGEVLFRLEHHKPSRFFFKNDRIKKRPSYLQNVFARKKKRYR